MSNVLVLIPARYDSSRFPGKPLAPINGVPMIELVYRNMEKSGFTVYVLTDNDEIEKKLLSTNSNVIRVNDSVETGTQRVSIGYNKLKESLGNFDLIVNVQGDEPLLKGESIKEIIDFHQKNSKADITTFYKKRLNSEDDFNNPNCVKIALNEKSGKCLYFSRSSIPYDRDDKKPWFQHIGIYCYKPEALEAFSKLSIGELEDREKLEQLRALENDFNIMALGLDYDLIGVDTPLDINKVEKILKG